MSFDEVWRFDLEEAIMAQEKFRALMNGGESDSKSFDTTQDQVVRIPGDASLQIYELRRMFRLLESRFDPAA